MLPAICSSLPCTYEEESVYTGVEPVTGADAEAAARAAQTVEEGGWSDWTAGLPNLSGLPTSLSNMTRGDRNCSFNERTVTIELAGAFRPFMIRTRETVGGVTETVDREIITPVASIELDWTAVANETRFLTSAHILLPQ